MQEPPHRAHRLVTLADEKVEQPAHERVFKVPSYRTAAPGEAEALETLAYMLGGGATSALYESLVVDRKLAVSAGAYYAGSAVDDTRFWVFATPAPDVTLEQLDAAMLQDLSALWAEGLVRSEGGIGTLLLNQNKYFNLSAVFAIQLTILAYGIVQDFGLIYLRSVLCPWTRLNRSDK